MDSLCFCGQAADVQDDSLYCSVKCARTDAMLALMGAEDSDSSSLSRESSASSHYRRREIAEVEKEKAKAKAEGREHQTGVWRYQKGRGKGKKVDTVEDRPVPPPIEKDHIPLTPTRFESLRIGPTSVPMVRGNVHAPSASTSTTGSTAPSFSSAGSRHSFSSSLSSIGSPVTPSYSDCPSTPPQFQYTHHQSNSTSHQIFQFPDTPSPNPKHLDIYDSFYLDKSPTLTIIPSPTKKLSFPSPPNQSFLTAMFQDTSLEEEERDQVTFTGRLEGGWGGEQLKERVRGGGKHKKGGLSFDDVVHLMQA